MALVLATETAMATAVGAPIPAMAAATAAAMEAMVRTSAQAWVGAIPAVPILPATDPQLRPIQLQPPQAADRLQTVDLPDPQQDEMDALPQIPMREDSARVDLLGLRVYPRWTRQRAEVRRRQRIPRPALLCRPVRANPRLGAPRQPSGGTPFGREGWSNRAPIRLNSTMRTWPTEPGRTNPSKSGLKIYCRWEPTPIMQILQRNHPPKTARPISRRRARTMTFQSRRKNRHRSSTSCIPSILRAVRTSSLSSIALGA